MNYLPDKIGDENIVWFSEIQKLDCQITLDEKGGRKLEGGT